jgi:hypothetical protein
MVRSTQVRQSAISFKSGAKKLCDRPVSAACDLDHGRIVADMMCAFR